MYTNISLKCSFKVLIDLCVSVQEQAFQSSQYNAALKEYFYTELMLIYELVYPSVWFFSFVVATA